MQEKEFRLNFIGRKKENKNKDFNYKITQVVYANSQDEAEMKVEEKYIIEEVI